MLKHKSFFSISFLIVGLLFFTSCIEEGGGNNRSDDFNRTILLESIADRLIVPAYQELSDSIDVVVTERVNQIVTTISGNIPKMAEGGIVNKPTLAMIGEGNEAEAVIPLSKLGKMGGGDININVTGGMATSAEIGQTIVNALRAYQRTSGGLQLNIA